MRTEISSSSSEIQSIVIIFIPLSKVQLDTAAGNFGAGMTEDTTEQAADNEQLVAVRIHTLVDGAELDNVLLQAGSANIVDSGRFAIRTSKV